MPLSRMYFRLASVLILLLGAGWTYLSRQPGSAAGAALSQAPQKGFTAPDFTAQTLTGENAALAAYAGKPIILNLWASWCPPCREETPALTRVALDYREAGLVVLGVNLTAQDSRQAATDFVAEYQPSFPIWLDLDGSISRLYRIQALPTTFFIGADGVIRDVIIGGPVSEALFRSQAEALTTEGR